MATSVETVTSPDQRRSGHRKLAVIGAWVSALLILVLLAGDHANDVEIAWVCGCAAVLLIAPVVDWQLRRSGLRS
jgi:hypothetical protein